MKNSWHVWLLISCLTIYGCALGSPLNTGQPISICKSADSSSTSALVEVSGTSLIAVDALSGVATLIVDGVPAAAMKPSSRPTSSSFEADSCRFTSNAILFITHVHKDIAAAENNEDAEAAAVEGFPEEGGVNGVNQSAGGDGVEGSNSNYSGSDYGSASGNVSAKGLGSAEAIVAYSGQDSLPTITRITIRNSILSSGSGITIGGLVVPSDGEAAVPPVHIDIHGNVFLTGAGVIFSGSLPSQSSIRIRGNKFLLGGSFVASPSALPAVGMGALFRETLTRLGQPHGMPPSIIIKGDQPLDLTATDEMAKVVASLLAITGDQLYLASTKNKPLAPHNIQPGARTTSVFGAASTLGITKNHFVSTPVTSPTAEPLMSLQLESPVSAVLADVGTLIALKGAAAVRIIYNYVVETSSLVALEGSWPQEPSSPKDAAGSSASSPPYRYSHQGLGPIELHDTSDVIAAKNSDKGGAAPSSSHQAPPAFLVAEKNYFSEADTRTKPGSSPPHGSSLAIIAINGAGLTLVSEGKDSLFQVDSNHFELGNGMGWWCPRIVVGTGQASLQHIDKQHSSPLALSSNLNSISVTFFRNFVHIKGAPTHPSASYILGKGHLASSAVAFGDIIMAPNLKGASKLIAPPTAAAKGNVATITAPPPPPMQGRPSSSQPSSFEISFNKVIVKGHGSAAGGLPRELLRVAFYGKVRLSRTNYLSIANNKIYTQPNLSPAIVSAASALLRLAERGTQMDSATPADAQIIFYGSHVTVYGAAKIIIKGNMLRKIAAAVQLADKLVPSGAIKGLLNFVSSKVESAALNAALVALPSTPLITFTGRVTFSGRSTLVVSDNTVEVVANHFANTLRLVSISADLGGSFAMTESVGYHLCGNAIRTADPIGLLSRNSYDKAQPAVSLSSITVFRPSADGKGLIGNVKDLEMSVPRDVFATLQLSSVASSGTQPLICQLARKAGRKLLRKADSQPKEVGVKQKTTIAAQYYENDLMPGQPPIKADLPRDEEAYHNNGIAIDDGEADLAEGGVDLDDFGPDDLEGGGDGNNQHRQGVDEEGRYPKPDSPSLTSGIEMTPLLMMVIVVAVAGAVWLTQRKKNTYNNSKKRAVLSARLKRTEIDF